MPGAVLPPSGSVADCVVPFHHPIVAGRRAVALALSPPSRSSPWQMVLVAYGPRLDAGQAAPAQSGDGNGNGHGGGGGPWANWSSPANLDRCGLLCTWSLQAQRKRGQEAPEAQQAPLHVCITEGTPSCCCWVRRRNAGPLAALIAFFQSPAPRRLSIHLFSCLCHLLRRRPEPTLTPRTPLSRDRAPPTGRLWRAGRRRGRFRFGICQRRRRRTRRGRPMPWAGCASACQRSAPKGAQRSSKPAASAAPQGDRSSIVHPPSLTPLLSPRPM